MKGGSGFAKSWVGQGHFHNRAGNIIVTHKRWICAGLWWKVKGGSWPVACGLWHAGLASGIWHVACGMGHVGYSMWHGIGQTPHFLQPPRARVLAQSAWNTVTSKFF
eukprot:1145029-Pelagomonas_calceolata.AAC.2